MRKHFLLAICIIFLIPVFITAQEKSPKKLPPEHFAPNREFDLINIKLDFSFNLAEKELIGKAEEKINPLSDNFQKIHLDAIGMKIKNVMLDDKKLNYDYDGKILTINFDKQYGSNDTLSFSVDYTTVPGKGMYFVVPEKAYPDRTPQIWTQSEMEDARYWYPCHDYPDDYSTSETITTVPANWVVVSNGILKNVTTNNKSKTKTFDWIENKPHVIYLNSIVAGVYSIIKDKYEHIPISYYVSPKYKNVAKENFTATPDILRFYSTVTGYRYPWDKLSLAAVTDFTFGGMENVSAITLTDNTLHNKADEPQASSTGLVAHETAHQWFGDLMTCRSWSNAWLNEGFATYFTALYEEHAQGEDAFAYQMMKDHNQVIYADRTEHRPTVYNRYYHPVDLFSPFIYPRGASILHMLRGIVGKDLFFKAIKYYVHKYKFYNVDSHDFQDAVQDATRKNLYWFWDEWLYKGGHPVFEVNYKYDNATHVLTLDVKQTQKTDDATPVYKMPVNVLIQTRSGIINKTITVDSVENGFTFDVKETPLMVNFDEGSFLLKELKFDKSDKELSFQLQKDTDVVGRIWAARRLAESKSETAEKALIEGLKSDPFYGVRVQCASSLHNYYNESTHKALMTALNDKDARVETSAIRSLDNFKDSVTLRTLTGIFNTAKNSYIRAACINSVSRIDTVNSIFLLDKALCQDSHGQIVAITALSRLAQISPDKAYTKAVELSQYGNQQSIRVSAIYLLAKLNIDKNKTLDLLKKYCVDPYIWARRGGLNGLGRIGSKEIIPFINKRKEIETDGRLKIAAMQAAEEIEKREK
jgi:aminopeptidase N